MIFGILAFIGFESAAPLGEEARHPRWTIPRAVVGSAVIIGFFYVLCSYAWVYGAGFDNFLTQATENPDPWPYPYRYGNWIALGWIVLGIIVTVVVSMRRPQALENADRIFVEDETVAPAPPPPEAR